MSSSGNSDKAGILLSQTGPFEELFRQQYSYVCQIVYRYVGDRSKVEDIAQDIFAELWLKKDSLYIHTSVAAYMRRMAISRALNYIRDTKKYDWDDLEMASEQLPEYVYQAPTAIQTLEEGELKNKITAAINQLPEKCRIVFLLSREEELSYAEISRQLSISIKTVENQISKALKLLRLAIADHRG